MTAADNFWTAVPLIGMPLGAGLATYGTIALLSRSRPLKSAVRDWIKKNKNAPGMIHSQFLLLRQTVFGNCALSWRRNISFAAIFLAVASLLSLFALMPIEDQGTDSFILLASHLYAFFYVHFWL